MSTLAYFGGVFRLLRYDNLASAVRKILRGYRREETVRFMAFRSHWRFAAEFCTPGKGHEKGGIEGEGGYFRRNHLVPVPRVADLDALNTMLVTACRADEARMLDGRSETIGATMAIERSHLLSCATEGLEKAAVIVTTNLPFSEWSQVIPNPRLCKALIDRLTDQAHIITTGADSYRFRRTTAQRKASKT